MHKCRLFCPFPPLAPSFSCPSLLSFMFPFLASSAKVSCRFVHTHLHCSAKGKAVAGEEMCLERKGKKQNKEVWPVIYQKIKCMGDKKTSLHTLFSILHSFFISIFFTLTEKVHLNVQKPNTNTTICTSKCCHSEITVRVIHPRLHPCHWASLLLMASSFFLCSLYFPSDSAACFIVFCHVSVIAPTACLMLSI